MYDMFDNDCLDYGPYTPSECSEASVKSAKGSTKMETEGSDKEAASQSSMDVDMDDLVVVDEVGSFDDQDTEEPCTRTVVDVGLYSQLASAVCSDSEATRFVSEQRETDEGQGAVRRKRGRNCPLCFEVVDRPRRHVIRFHLPWYWMPTTACWQCRKQEAQRGKHAINHTLDHGGGGFTDAELHEWCQLVNGALFMLAGWLECDTLGDLLRHVLDCKLYLDVRSEFSDDDLPIMQFYALHYSDDQPTRFSIKPPNHVICLLNWELISKLLSKVGGPRHKKFLKSKRRLTACGMNVIDQEPVETERLFLIDTHFHLDLVLKRGKFGDYQHLHRIVNQFNTTSVLYLGVTNYVFPDHWAEWHSQVAGQAHLQVTFGIHPHITANGVSRSQLGELRSLLTTPRCVALGEIGIDDTTRCRCQPCGNPERCRTRIRRNQEEAFIEMIYQAKELDLPVILHTRDTNTGEASARVLTIIREVGAAGLKFHRHSFIGSFEELQEWRVLPRVRFGISWKTCQESPDVVARLESREILLETDSPYLSPYPECRINHPWNLEAVAQRVSEIRNVPLSILMETINRNSIDFYGLRHSYPERV